MRVVSLVPSWTETLIECGVNVVGRTRYCVRPPSAIPIVGGTKDLDVAKLLELKPDILLVDKEENLPHMAEHISTYITHVESIHDMPRELTRLSEAIKNQKLRTLAQEWHKESASPNPQPETPGVLEWIRKPRSEPKQVLYIIWREPWMTVSAETFPGSMLTHLGQSLAPQATKYPEIDLADYHPDHTLLLFASEPYPFHKKARELTDLPFPSAVVDGEAYSWFGVRSLKFLKSLR